MGKQDREGKVKVIDGKKAPLCRKTACYKFTLFIIAVLLASLIISCVIIVVLRGELVGTDRVTVKVGNLELRVKRDMYDILMEYFDKVDVDGNGTLSLEAAHAHFDVLDTNKKGAIKSDAVVNSLGPQFEIVFEAEDFDHDGILRRADVIDVHERVDIDDDEFVSKDEFVFYHELARRALHDREAL